MPTSATSTPRCSTASAAADSGALTPPSRSSPSSSNGPDPPVHYEHGFPNGNGIVATADGRHLLVVHETTGELFRVRLSDKQVRPVDLGRYRLVSGRGMVLTDDRVLYVVRAARPAVAKLRLDAHYRRARLLSETTDPTFNFPRPRQSPATG